LNRDLDDEFFSRKTQEPSWRAQTQIDQYLDVNLDQKALISAKAAAMSKTSPRGFT